MQGTGRALVALVILAVYEGQIHVRFDKSLVMTLVFFDFYIKNQAIRGILKILLS